MFKLGANKEKIVENEIKTGIITIRNLTKHEINGCLALGVTETALVVSAC
jgi:hypothetical protein